MKGLYDQLILPTPFKILGRDLKPFSLGHYIILRNFDVSFVADEPRTITLKDVVFSIFVCSHTFEENKALLERGAWFRKVKQWGKQIHKDTLAAIPEGLTIDDVIAIDWGEVIELFRQYLAHHTQCPRFRVLKKAAPGQESNSEWYENNIKVLMGECGYSHSEVINMSFGRARYEFLSYQEGHGLIAFLSEDQENRLLEFQEKMRKAKQQQFDAFMKGSNGG